MQSITLSQKIWNISVNEDSIAGNSLKHCSKRKNCLFSVISPFCHDLFNSSDADASKCVDRWERANYQFDWYAIPFRIKCLIFSHMQIHFDASAADGFWKNCGTGENAQQYLPLLPQHFLNHSNSFTFFNKREFQLFCLIVFQVVCYRFVVCCKVFYFRFKTKTQLIIIKTLFQFYNILTFY